MPDTLLVIEDTETGKACLRRWYLSYVIERSAMGRYRVSHNKWSRFYSKGNENMFYSVFFYGLIFRHENLALYSISSLVKPETYKIKKVKFSLHSPIHSPTPTFTHSSIHPSIYPPMHLFTHLFIWHKLSTNAASWHWSLGDAIPRTGAEHIHHIQLNFHEEPPRAILSLKQTQTQPYTNLLEKNKKKTGD